LITVRLGRTGIEVRKDGFGGLPLQRIAASDAERILKKALDGGINFFDTARSYMDSEEKLGQHFLCCGINLFSPPRLWRRLLKIFGGTWKQA
jgi:aryl-alcohol dehydrogenase-like predicted oxidoreductase